MLTAVNMTVFTAVTNDNDCVHYSNKQNLMTMTVFTAVKMTVFTAVTNDNDCVHCCDK